MMTVLLWLCAVLAVGLFAYSLVHYACAGLVLTGRGRGNAPRVHPEEGVTVLVPARNEGERVLRTLSSLVAQDHAGAVAILLLLRDAADSAVPHLARAFPAARLDAAPPVVVPLLRTPRRRVDVAFTGVEAKSEKLNWAGPRLETPYAAILDGDHQAHPDWLRTSLALLRGRGARIIQGRRGPLSARGFFALWDALHQHVGCELFNAAFARLGLTAFFTGTTAVMESALLRAHSFRACLTEDADWSYDRVLAGERIIHNPWSGSDEELSPDLYSFVARRRRWANGHTETFLRHLRQQPAARLGLARRLQFLFHGLHYLVAVPVLLLHLGLATLFVVELPLGTAVAAALLALSLATLILSRQQTRGTGARLAELGVLSLWLFSGLVIAAHLTLAAAAGELDRAALALPGSIQVMGLVGLCAPLCVLVVGMVRFRQVSLGTLAVVVVTFPLAFFLDLGAVLVGLADALDPRRQWRPVTRAVPVALAGSARFPRAPVESLGIGDSFSLSRFFAPLVERMARVGAPLWRPARSFGPSAILVSTLLGVWYCTTAPLELHDADCRPLQHDTDPWIVPLARLPDFCGPAGSNGPRIATRSGAFELRRQDDLAGLDGAFWDRLDSTFFCNLATFTPENVVPAAGGGIDLPIRAEARGEKRFTAGSIATKPDAAARFLYGRFEAVLRPAKVSGVVSALFLYRFDPWQEIDLEFVGRDTTRILLNVYYNPGEEGDRYNYGFTGTPVLVDLGFDAADDFHRYAIEWEPEAIRWFVDGRLIHSRPTGRTKPIPHLPMRLYVNAWPACSEELAGPLAADALPAAASVRSVAVSTWSPPLAARLRGLVASLFSSADDPARWRERADWIQPR